MKVKFSAMLALFYFLLAFLLFKNFNFFSIAFLITALLIDYFTNISPGIKNLFYLIAALSVYPSVMSIFLIFLPFSIFGGLLAKKSFTRNYILAYAISFIPANIIYLLTTYLSIKLNYIAILIIFYSLPLAAIVALRRIPIRSLEIDNREILIVFIVLLFTTVIAASIVNDKSMFMANGVRIFSRTQVALKGLNEYGIVPTYNPGIAQGEATYLWNTPSFKVHVALVNYMLKPKSSIMYFNSLSFFILFISTLGIGVLFWSLINNEQYIAHVLAVAATAAMTGLNFYFLQKLESFKAFYTYPIAYLFLSLIVENPKKFNEYLILMYFSAIFITIHLPYGSGVLLIGGCMFVLVKRYYVKDKSELKLFLEWLLKNKIRIITTLMIVLSLPIFYLSASFVYKDFLSEADRSGALRFGNTIQDSINFFKSLVSENILSIRYPDVNRLDDHKIGLFMSVFGAMSFLFLILMFKSESAKNFRIFAFALILNLIVSSLIEPKVSILLGGGLSYRTAQPYQLILLGASILTLIYFVKNKYIKYALIAAVFLAFIHTVPYAKQNITNVHQEMFASGDVYKEEIDFIKKLPIDGRIITYGLFSNAVDFGSNYLTDRYFSRNERTEFNIERSLWERVHGQHSFGDSNVINSKSGAELSNYLALGGYKYLFMNWCHPTGNYVAQALYPNFTYPIYQNECLLFLVVNKTNYAEEVDLVKNAPEEAYKQNDGYKYVTISPYYTFENHISFKSMPKIPEPLRFDRITPTEVHIYGDFEKNDFVVFKEQYFPRWKAYMDNKEVPVMATNFDLILVQAEKGSEILLKYAVLPKEKIFGILSLIAHIGLAFFIIFLTKQAIII